MRRLGWVWLLVMVSIAALRATTASAQNAATPKFDAVSVKPCAPGDGSMYRDQAVVLGVQTSPGRLHINCLSVVELMNVYARVGNERLLNDSAAILDDKRVRGGPEWGRSDRYTIDAETTAPLVAGSGSQAGDLLRGPMLRGLVEDRFQLKVHRASEEIPT